MIPLREDIVRIPWLHVDGWEVGVAWDISVAPALLQAFILCGGGCGQAVLRWIGPTEGLVPERGAPASESNVELLDGRRPVAGDSFPDCCSVLRYVQRSASVSGRCW